MGAAGPDAVHVAAAAAAASTRRPRRRPARRRPARRWRGWPRGRRTAAGGRRGSPATLVEVPPTSTTIPSVHLGVAQRPGHRGRRPGVQGAHRGGAEAVEVGGPAVAAHHHHRRVEAGRRRPVGHELRGAGGDRQDRRVHGGGHRAQLEPVEPGQLGRRAHREPGLRGRCRRRRPRCGRRRARRPRRRTPIRTPASRNRSRVRRRSRRRAARRDVEEHGLGGQPLAGRQLDTGEHGPLAGLGAGRAGGRGRSRRPGRRRPRGGR